MASRLSASLGSHTSLEFFIASRAVARAGEALTKSLEALTKELVKPVAPEAGK